MSDPRDRAGSDAPPGLRLRFATDQGSAFVDYALPLIELAAGVRLERVEGAPVPVDVYYGNDSSREFALRIPAVESYAAATIPQPQEPGSGGHRGQVFPFDLFAAMRFWLADEAHQASPRDHFDEHGRLLPEHSAHVALGVAEVPIVNAYLIRFRSEVARLFEVAPRSYLPPGKRCAVVLTHDVDSPLDPGSSRHPVGLALDNARHGKRVGPSLAYAAGAVFYAASSRRRDPKARHFLFTEVMAAEEQKGFRSTFFFASTSRFSSSGCRRDVGYDVTRTPLPEAVAEVAERGHEVGLHIGYLAGADPDRIAAERVRLERVAGVPIVSSRHHYYHMTRPFWASLAAHAEAGLTIDTSISFNYTPGYRLGIALPFRPWNPETGAGVGAVQVPTMLMDSMVCSQPGQTVDGALERVTEVIAGLKQFEGVAAVDWHEYTSYPGSERLRTWGETYLDILDLLESDPEVAVYTLPEAAALAVPRDL
jgi:hypothetical protein